MCCGQKRLALRSNPIRTTGPTVPQIVPSPSRDRGGRIQTVAQPALRRTVAQNPTVNSQARIIRPQSRLIGRSVTRLSAFVAGTRGRP